MDSGLYKEFLVEEEKFLKVLERNLKDQINRLKVEELSILKLISTSDPSQYGNSSLTNHELLPDADMPLFQRDGTINTPTPSPPPQQQQQHQQQQQQQQQPTWGGKDEDQSKTVLPIQEMNSELAHKTSNDYAGFSSHSNHTSPQRENASSSLATTTNVQTTVLKDNVELNTSLGELNDSRPQTDPSDVTVPGDELVGASPPMAGTHVVEMNREEEEVFRGGTHTSLDAHLNDVAVNAIPLDLELKQDVDSVEVSLHGEDFVEEMEEDEEAEEVDVE